MNQMKEVVLEHAIDESLRRTSVGRRFLVLPQCEKAFIEELQASKVLQDIVYRYKRSKSGFFRRLMRVRNVIRLQYVINVRTKGIERTKKLSLRSGILFVASHRVAGWLDLYWRWRDARKARPLSPSL
jgi:hypothetical protein